MRLLRKALLVMAIAAANLAAQVTSGTILGTVADASGAAVTDASVSAKNLETNAVREVTTDVAGRFRMFPLPPGSYEVTVGKAGFSKYVQGPITLRLNQSAELDVKLSVSATSETITVTSDATLVNTTNAEVGVNFDARRISEVPLAPNRNILNLALNVAGVSQLSRGQSEFANTGNSGTDASPQMSVNGMRTRSNNYMIDGQDSNDPSVTGLTQAVNNPDIVAEFRLITSQFLPEYGRAAGSVVNIITKSGTNGFHGSGFWFHNSNKLNSRSNLDERLFSRAPWRINNQVGATSGGRIIKDKTFYFASIQRWTDRKLGSGSTISGAPTEAGRQVLQPFASRPTIKALLDFLPAAQTSTGQSASFTTGGQTYRVPLGSMSGATTNTFDDWQWSARVDHRFTQNHNWATRYMYDDSINAGGGQATPPGLTTLVPSRRMAITSALTSTLSPRMYNEFRASYQRFASQSTATDPRSESIPSIEVNELGLTGFNAAASRTAIGLAVNLPQFRRNNTYQLQETIGMTRGSHSMKFGIDLRRADIVSFFLPTLRGRLAYASLQTLVDDVALSTQINAPLKGGKTNQYYKYYDYFFFLQDEWRVTPRLMLTYGIRYETPGNPMQNLADANAAIVAANNGDARFKLSPVPARDTNNWAPRLGFNYRVMDRTVLRGGYSRTYDVAFINIGLNVGSAFPFLYSDSLPANAPNAFNALRALGANPNPTAPDALVQTQVTSDFRSPYAEQLSFQVQRELAKDWGLTVGWVGTKGTALFQTVDGNPTVPGVTPVRRLNPAIGIRRVRANAASSIYHSLQTSLEKRFTNGFSLGSHYTWSTFIDYASEIFNPAVNGDVAVSQDSYNRRAERGRSTFDRPHRFTSTFIYELPFLSDQKNLANRILGGWQVSGFLTFQAGAPFTPLAGIDPGLRLNGIDGLVGNAIRGNVATDRAISNMNIGEIFAFNTPAAVNNSRNSLFTNVTAANPLGNAGRNIIRADGIGEFSMGAFKKFGILEGHNLEFRAEFYNLTNTRNFGIPESRINAAAFVNQWNTDGGNRRVQMGLRYVW